MKCKKCGTELQEEHQYCHNCGTKVYKDNNRGIRKISKLFIIVFILLICIIGVSCLKTSNVNNDTIGTTTNSKSNNKTKSKTTWSYSEDGKITDGNMVIKIGDYVNYDEQSGASYYTYTSQPTQNGKSTEEFNLKQYNDGWRIFGIEDGQLMLISETLIAPSDVQLYQGDYNYGKDYFILGGKKGYNNISEELDNICSMYGQGKYANKARSITVKDINSITGYIPDCDRVAYSHICTKYSYNPVTLKEIYSIPKENEEIQGISKDSIEYEMLFKTKKSGSLDVTNCIYFLASGYENATSAGFNSSPEYGIYCVENGLVKSEALYVDFSFSSSESKNKDIAGYIRPIVYLSEYAKLQAVGTSLDMYDIYE